MRESSREYEKLERIDVRAWNKILVLWIRQGSLREVFDSYSMNLSDTWTVPIVQVQYSWRGQSLDSMLTMAFKLGGREHFRFSSSFWSVNQALGLPTTFSLIYPVNLVYLNVSFHRNASLRVIRSKRKNWSILKKIIVTNIRYKSYVFFWQDF